MVGAHTDLVRAIVLIVALALLALETGPDLGADTDTVALLDGLDGLADLDGLAYDLVSHTDGQGCATPTTVDGVDIGAADTAALDLDVDVVVAEDFGLEGLLLDCSEWLGRGSERGKERVLQSVHFLWSLIMKP